LKNTTQKKRWATPDLTKIRRWTKVTNDQVNVYSSCYYLKSTALLQSSLIDIDYNMAFSILALVSSLDPYQSSAIALGWYGSLGMIPGRADMEKAML
jgi:hypothetical protein